MASERSRNVATHLIVLAVGAVLAASLATPAGGLGGATKIEDGFRADRDRAFVRNGRLYVAPCDQSSGAYGNVHCAEVDRGRLFVGDAEGPLTVDGRMDVGGKVVAVPTKPRFPLNDFVVLDGEVPVRPLFYPNPVADADRPGISSLTFSNNGQGKVLVLVEIAAGMTAGCTGEKSVALTLLTVNVDGGATEHLAYPQPLMGQIPQNTAPKCVRAVLINPQPGDSVDVSAVGFDPT